MTNIEQYLADADYDGAVTGNDATRIQLVIAGNYIY